MPQHAQPRERRDHRDGRAHQVLDDRQVAALGIGVVAVEVAAEDEPALVRLADVEVPGAISDDAGDERLHCFRHKRLQYMAFDRQAEAGHRRDQR